MAAKLKFIAPGIQVRIGDRGNTIRYFTTVGGERKTKTSGIDYALAVNPKNHKPTSILMTDYQMWVDELSEQHEAKSGRGLRVPTLAEMRDLYEKVATARMRNPAFRKPGERAIETALKNFRYCVEESGFEWEDPCTKILDRKTIKGIFAAMSERMKPISAWSYVVAIQSLTTKWAIEEYENLGYKVPEAEMPVKPATATAPQYEKLTKEMREKIEVWYAGLSASEDRWMYLAATMMAQLAMRDCDVLELTADNFIADQEDPNGLMHLRYQPRKTKNSSGRWVDWPIMAAHWDLIREVAGERLDAGLKMFPMQRCVFDRLNKSMREACGMQSWNKAVYELRKMCIDNVRRVMGADAAVQISGDRRETVDHYYADPFKAVGVTPIETMPLGKPKES